MDNIIKLPISFDQNGVPNTPVAPSPTLGGRKSAIDSLPPEQRRARYMAAGILAIIFGQLGIHEFILGKISLGVAHIVLTLLPMVALFASCNSEGICVASSSNSFIGAISVMGPSISSFWGFVEGIILIAKYSKSSLR